MLSEWQSLSLWYCVSFHIDKTNFILFFKKWILFFLNFEIFFFPIIYYDIVIWVMKLFRMLAYDNYDDFQHVKLHIFTNFSFHYFGRLLNDPKPHTNIDIYDNEDSIVSVFSGSYFSKEPLVLVSVFFFFKMKEPLQFWFKDFCWNFDRTCNSIFGPIHSSKRKLS